MLSLMREWLTCTSVNNAWLALRMELNMSAMGSLILPASLRYAWDQAIQRRFAKRQTRAGKFADVCVASAGDLAAVDQADWTGIARQLLQRGVVLALFQFGAQGGVFFYSFSFALVALQ